ncbi:cyclophilin-like fold protein [Candidatus Methanomassiliicoccus intestinalis]|uniref:cyclophilin-like fold protein n=1 Tax=Candidatus Methanomassiliicoccus intestinalis TaxID=1406512 RepID=UPI0037DC2A19
MHYKKALPIILIIFVCAILVAVLGTYFSSNSEPSADTPSADDPQDKPDETRNTLQLQVGNETFTIVLEDNASATALQNQLPLTVTMSELNGNEKYYYLPESLPTNSQRVGQISTGDFMLYGSDCLVLFYESFSTSYSYTKLGSVEDTAGLAAALGDGKVQVTFS